MLLSPSLNFLCQCFSDAVRIYLAFQLSHQLSYEKSHNLVLAAQKFSQRSRIGIYDLFHSFGEKTCIFYNLKTILFYIYNLINILIKYFFKHFFGILCADLFFLHHGKKICQMLRCKVYFFRIKTFVLCQA